MPNRILRKCICIHRLSKRLLLILRQVHQEFAQFGYQLFLLLLVEFLKLLLYGRNDLLGALGMPASVVPPGPALAPKALVMAPRGRDIKPRAQVVMAPRPLFAPAGRTFPGQGRHSLCPPNASSRGRAEPPGE